MELTLQSLNNSSTGLLTVNEAVFGAPYNEALIHQSVVAYLAGARAGTVAQKNRAKVRGSTAKPWKQKGTGRARAGHVRSPLWRGGGVTFAAQPADHSQKLNKKMYAGAMRSILSELIRQQRLIAVDNFDAATPKTRDLVAQLKDLLPTKLLIITDKVSNNLGLAARNLFNVRLAAPMSLDPVSLVWADKVIITRAALTELEGRFA